MNQQPPLTHPATNPDGTCDDRSCPCHEFAQMPTTAASDDTISDCEPVRPDKQDHVIIQPGDSHPHSEDSLCAICDGGLAICKLCGKAEIELDEPCTPSTALRNTRSIVHHAELVAEQGKRDNLPLAAPETRRNILDAIEADKAIDALGDKVRQQRLVAHSTFDDAWDAAPESLRRVTEIEAAEFFYYAGRRDRETEILRRGE